MTLTAASAPASTTVFAPAPGTLGIGVGDFRPPMAARGETAPVFESRIWFPFESTVDAYEYAREVGATALEGVAL